MRRNCFILFCDLLLVFLSAQLLAQELRFEDQFFNGKDLTGWSGNLEYWTVKNGTIVGASEKPFPINQFLWSNVDVVDFYLDVDVRLTPNQRNAGIQFRSRRLGPDSNLAFGYQADIGHNVWGRLYHEHGRHKLDWTDRGEKAVKIGEWNRYEILAVGHRIWTAINGQLSVAIHDPAGELSGRIALQIHSGQAQTAEYRIKKLIHNPKIELAGMTRKQLVDAAKTLYPVVSRKLDFDNENLLGTRTGNVELDDSELAGKCLLLSGSGASVDYKLSNAWKVGEGPFSISVWVKPTKLSKAGILCAGGYGRRHGWLVDTFPDGSVRFATSMKSGANNGALKSPQGALRVGRWANILVTVDNNRCAKLLVNGKCMANSKLGTDSLTKSQAQLVVGAIENSRDNSFQGAIDEIQLWPKALSQAEIDRIISPYRKVLDQ